MLNKLLEQLRQYDMLQPGERLTCAVSGGADSMALLWGMYLLKDKLGITLCAAHFNHGLRGEESARDEAFVRSFCDRYEIPLTVGSGSITAGKKGLEAAARDARYAFLNTLPGKIATAHTADDNAETVLMHLVRGTGLKGLGGIAPVNGRIIRPMLGCTRQQVLAFLQEYHVDFVEDSSNAEDAFLRNRLRHHVMPLLKKENPSLAENLSQTAMALRLDEQALEQLSAFDRLPDVSQLRQLHPAVRRRMLERFLKDCGVKEPERRHMELAEELVFSQKPSATGCFPGGVTIRRNYERLERVMPEKPAQMLCLPQEGAVEAFGLRITVSKADELINNGHIMTVEPEGKIILRSRCSGDELRLSGGTKSLKKLFIDRKIPATQRQRIPVLADDKGVLGVYGIGVHVDRAAKKLPAVQIRFETL